MGKITALCFLKIAKGKIPNVVEQITKISRVKQFLLLTGDYDGLIEFEIDEPDELYDIWVKELDHIDGIVETNTHVVMKHVDLKQHLRA